MKALVRRLRRSLAAPLILLVAAFIAVPILFYLTFQQADQERQECCSAASNLYFH